MDWTFGKAEKKDFRQINALFMEMLRTVYETEQVSGYPDGALDRFFDGSDGWISTATDGGRIVAFLSVEVHSQEPPCLYLDDFSVTKEYRGKGIGSAMLGLAESRAAEKGISVILLHVEKTNTAALGLYQRLGYTVEEDQGSRYLMAKRIP